MFTVFVLFGFSIGVLTFLALKNNGSNQAEIKITLSFMAANSKALFKNIKTLITLLIKDLFQSELSSNPIDIVHESSKQLIIQNEESNKIDSTINQFMDSNEDESINSFSPEVIEIIREEEEKVA